MTVVGHVASVCTESPLGGDRRWLLNYGPVSALSYDTAAPGGPTQLSCHLECGANFSGIVAAPGRTVKVFVGGYLAWAGTLDEPTPTEHGLDLKATGISAAGGQYLAVSTSLPSAGSGTTGPGNAMSIDTVVDNAIARGMPWIRANNCPALYGYKDPGCFVTDALQAAMQLHGQPWYVLPDGTMFWFTWPTTPAYLLIATSTGGGRTRDGMETDVAARYQNASGVPVMTDFVGNSFLRAGMGRKEQFLDLTGRGNAAASTLPALPAAIATALNAELAASGQRAAWSGTFPAPRGMLRTLGGAIVDPAAVISGQMVKVALTDAGQWGESGLDPITFVIGQTSYDADTDTVQLTPLQSAKNDLGAALIG